MFGVQSDLIIRRNLVITWPWNESVDEMVMVTRLLDRKWLHEGL